ncbi:ubiquitin carboxyl-terminal hydrolase 14 [Tetranychus urticae]|uniref:Ubiquitin carboxyl-terminal hydrolase n=1 Tax=Tetranychus urticae TaxID=32264 RepID=T1JTK6_TETUR|nr:ubiquitin carboxyl-terminal hydrolase 14 [Tetranychus urticae]
MPVYKVKVKWGKEVYDAIDLDTDLETAVFKAQVFALTSVPIERQKLMFKGKVISGASWDAYQIKDGITLLMMGTADKIPEEPIEKPKFIEDMSENELTTALDLPSGLTNLGNTCYLNATVQCLKTIPELKEAITKFVNSHDSGSFAPNVTASLRDLFGTMESRSVVAPMVFLTVFHMAFPRFAEKSPDGNLIQHDAAECWTSLMRSLQQDLKTSDKQGTGDNITEARASKNQNFIEQYFEGNFAVTMKNTESEIEEETKTVEKFLHLSCFISNHEVKYLQSGLKYSILEETLTKFSPTLQRDCLFTKKSLLARLPAYLTIQIMRFEYKGREAKILKEIKFGLTLDVFEMCTPELQEKLLPMRNKFKAQEDKLLAESQNADRKKDDKKGDKKDEKPKYQYPYYFKDDIGSNNSGYYELQAVLTHKGRNIASGHYLAWIKRNKDEWFQCDDDNVTQVTTDDILRLSGGGDWHCAYLLLYGPRVLEVDDKPDNPDI